jgi:hypothetical protein
MEDSFMSSYIYCTAAQKLTHKIADPLCSTFVPVVNTVAITAQGDTFLDFSVGFFITSGTRKPVYLSIFGAGVYMMEIYGRWVAKPTLCTLERRFKLKP